MIVVIILVFLLVMIMFTIADKFAISRSDILVYGIGGLFVLICGAFILFILMELFGKITQAIRSLHHKRKTISNEDDDSRPERDSAFADSSVDFKDANEPSDNGWS